MLDKRRIKSVTVLVEGYAKEWGSSGWEATSTVTLVQDNGLNIICDPGTNINALEAGLKECGLKYSDIDWVFLTHWHPVTCLNVALFNKAKMIDSRSIYWGGRQDLHDGKIPGTDDFYIRLTPGHCADHASLIVPLDDTVYVVAGDVFWWAADEDQITDRKSLLEKKDSLAIDQKALRKSRESILGTADFIIPGHGKTFKVE